MKILEINFYDVITSVRYSHLQPTVACMNVTIPETNTIVLRTLLITTGLSEKQSAPDRMNGTTMVELNISMYCWKEKQWDELMLSRLFQYARKQN